EAAARLELLRSTAARADPAKQDQPAILARALDRHDESRHHEGRDQYEVRTRDEQTAQRERPAHPQPRERPTESLGRCLLDDDGRYRARRIAECCERRLSFNLDHHLLLSVRRKRPRLVHGSRAEPLRDEVAITITSSPVGGAVPFATARIRSRLLRAQGVPSTTTAVVGAITRPRQSMPDAP